MKTFAYIDASNLYYGGKKSLGWSLDFQKLSKYLQERFGASKIYYFGGIEIYKFPFNYLTRDTVPLNELEEYLTERIATGAPKAIVDPLKHHLQQVHFYQKLEEFGFILILKPVKIYSDSSGNQKRKANCDVEMALYMMRDSDTFDRAVILSGDGDFLPILKYLREVLKKKVLILSHGARTAKEIKQFAREHFIDLTNNNLREKLERLDKTKSTH